MLLSVSAPLAAQPSQPAAPPQHRTTAVPQLGGTASPQYPVRLLTMGQGDQIWERFGHNALAVHDPLLGLDLAYNWGLFDFAQPGFLARFLTGDTQYWMEGFDVGATLRAYGSHGREVVEQSLALTPAQRDSLIAFLRWNARPENRYYRYDYFLDNCSTRLRDAIDRVLGGALRRQTEKAMSGTTFRSHTQRLLEDNLLAYVGITIALGQPADREISAWEEMFLPVRLRDRLDAMRVDSAGTSRPLVGSRRVLLTTDRAPEPATPSNSVPWFVGAGVALGALLLVTGSSRTRSARLAFMIIAVAWLTLGGTLGVILSLAWATTRHVFWYRNENLLLFSPLLLALAIALPLAMRKKAGDRVRRAAYGLVMAVAGLSLFALVVKATPWFFQKNWEVIGLVLPVHLALAAMVWRQRNIL